MAEGLIGKRFKVVDPSHFCNGIEVTIIGNEIGDMLPVQSPTGGRFMIRMSQLKIVGLDVLNKIARDSDGDIAVAGFQKTKKGGKKG